MGRVQLTRRSFVLQLAAVTAGTAGVPRSALTQETPRLDERNPAAIALRYVHDATRADSIKSPTYRPGQTCVNCLWVQGEEGVAWRPCAKFPGKLVSAAGWCNVWVAKT